MRRTLGSLVTLLFGAGLEFAVAGGAPQADPQAASVQPLAPSQGTQEKAPGARGVDASSVILPCTPVAAYWTGPPQSAGMPPGPELAVVSVDVRPKDARLYLDERFVGRARYLDGRPGYLYLAPGTYLVELRLDGYRTVAIDLTAEAGCRFDLKHRLVRIKGTPKENKSANYGKGRPFNRVFTPRDNVEQAKSAAARGPDSALRPDLGGEASSSRSRPRQGAALRLSVSPLTASIAIDGNFVATARELDRMEGPLAVTIGSHQIEVTAPGHQSVSRSVDLKGGEVVDLSVDLPASLESGQ